MTGDPSAARDRGWCPTCERERGAYVDTMSWDLRQRCSICSTVLRALADTPLPDVAASPCECCGGDRLTVCAACEQHACWAGDFMCEYSRTAGTKQLTAAVADVAEEWGVRFGSTVNPHQSHDGAEVEAREYDGELVRRAVGPWTAATHHSPEEGTR